MRTGTRTTGAGKATGGAAEVRHTTTIGVFASKEGEHYDGQWREDKKNGVGAFDYPSGDKYEGEWTDNLRDGKGTFRRSNGDSVKGVWEKDVLRKIELCRYANGDEYSGGWADDHKEGKGMGGIEGRHNELQERRPIRGELGERPEEQRRYFRVQR